MHRFASLLALLSLTFAPGNAVARDRKPSPAASPAGSAERDSLAVADTLMARFFERIPSRIAPDSQLAIAQRALDIRARWLAADDLAIAVARTAHGVALVEAGDAPTAVVELHAAIEGLERSTAVDSTMLGVALNSLGRALNLMRNFKAARHELERALAITEASSRRDGARQRVILNNLANAVASGGDLKAAQTMYERLIALEEAYVPVDSVRLAINLNNLANVVSDLGDQSRGLELYARALTIRERVFGPRSTAVATTLNNAASLAEAMGQDTLALVYMTRAIEIRRANMGDRHPLTAEWVAATAAIEGRLGRWEPAFDHALASERDRREHLLLATQSLSASDALRYETLWIRGLHVALTLLETHARADSARCFVVFDALVRSRALLLDELAARRRAQMFGVEPAFASLEQVWRETRQHYTDLVLRGLRASARDSTYRRTVESARAAAERAEERLAAASARHRREEQAERLGAADVLAALPPGSALVSFVRHASIEANPSGVGPPRYAAFVAPPGGRITYVPLGATDIIDSLVDVWREAITSPPASGGAIVDVARYRTAATPLRAAVWDPLVPALRDTREVFVVPDGALQLVNFATLPMGEGYLVEGKAVVHVLSAERALVSEPARSTELGDLLVMGGVDYDGVAPMLAAVAPATYRSATPDCGDLRGETLRPLPGSMLEAADVSATWKRLAPGARVLSLSGRAANEQAFKRLAPTCTAIHLATHGFFVDPDCNAGSEVEDVAGNPLLLSGVALAGANQNPADSAGTEDGWLTAEEISALDLSRVRWVVLSSCGSGLGTIEEGEGVFGLRRAFEIAGAGTLVTSLWEVGDEGTRHWMTALYAARFSQHLSAPASVRAASVAYLRDLRALHRSTHPREWGAFVASGDWR